MKKIAGNIVFGLVAVAALGLFASCSGKKSSGARKIQVAHTNYYVPYDFVDEVQFLLTISLVYGNWYHIA